jgi:hypothetical protein
MIEALDAGLRNDQVVTSDDDQAHQYKQLTMTRRNLAFLIHPQATEASSLGLSGALKFRVIITPVMLMSGKYSAEIAADCSIFEQS